MALALPSDPHVAALVALYSAAMKRLDRLIAGAVSRGAVGTATYYENQKAQVAKILDQLAARSRPLEEAAIRASYRGSVSAVDASINRSKAFSGVHTAAEGVLAANLAARLRHSREFVGRRVDDVFRQAALEEVGISVGAGTGQRELKADLIARLRREGKTGFVDRRGREWSLDTYAAMVARTTTREASSVGIRNRLIDHGFDLARVSEHRESCPICIPYQGNTYSLTGATEGYEMLEVLPPFHPNCRHVLLPAPTTFEDFERALGSQPAPTAAPAAAPTDEQEVAHTDDVDELQRKVDSIKERYAPATEGTPPSLQTLKMAGKEIDVLVDEEIERRAPGAQAELKRLEELKDANILAMAKRKMELKRDAEKTFEEEQKRADLLANKERAENLEIERDEIGERYNAAIREWGRFDPRTKEIEAEFDAKIKERNEFIETHPRPRTLEVVEEDFLREDPELAGYITGHQRIAEERKTVEAVQEMANEDATLAVLERFRDFGGPLTLKSRRGLAVKGVDEALRFFPSEWIERANEMLDERGETLQVLTTRGRAFFFPPQLGEGPRIEAQDPKRSGDYTDLVHELAHFFEFFSGESFGEKVLPKAEADFFEERTEGNPLQRLPGKGPSEVYREGRFFTKYVGRDYRSQGMDAYEILSMGMEHLFFKRPRINQDREHAQIILAMLGLSPSRVAR